MVVYTLEQCWEVGLTEDAYFGKKIIFSDEAHFDFGKYLKKTSKIVAFGAQKIRKHTLQSRRT